MGIGENSLINSNLYKYKISIAYQAGDVKGVGAKEGKGIGKTGDLLAKGRAKTYFLCQNAHIPQGAPLWMGAFL